MNRENTPIKYRMATYENFEQHTDILCEEFLKLIRGRISTLRKYIQEKRRVIQENKLLDKEVAYCDMRAHSLYDRKQCVDTVRESSFSIMKLFDVCDDTENLIEGLYWSFPETFRTSLWLFLSRWKNLNSDSEWSIRHKAVTSTLEEKQSKLSQLKELIETKKLQLDVARCIERESSSFNLLIANTQIANIIERISHPYFSEEEGGDEKEEQKDEEDDDDCFSVSSYSSIFSNSFCSTDDSLCSTGSEDESVDDYFGYDE